MSWTETISKRIRQVDPYHLADSFEMAFDLGPHLSAEPFFVPEDKLADFLRCWYTEMRDESWTNTDLARRIIRHFNLKGPS